MNWKISLLLLSSLLLFSCNTSEKQDSIPVIEDKATFEGYSNSDHLIEVSALIKQADNPNYKLIHFGRRAEYIAGHLPGALNIWRNHIEDSLLPYRGIMAPKAQIESIFSTLGIKNSDTLIIYDTTASCDAARLWWVLENYGFKNTKILNGGIQAWRTANGPITKLIPELRSSQFTLPEIAPMQSVIDHDALLSGLNSNTPALLLDTRTLNEFTGKRQKQGATAAGRIPNSLFMPWAACVNYNGDKKFKSYATLNTMYTNIISNKKQAIIAYCHSGVRSAHTIFVLQELLGYTNVKNYDGSWTEWSYLSDYPKVKDSITTIFN